MATTTQNKTIEFEKLIPDFKRFAASKRGPREILKYVHYDGSYITIMDGHRMLRVNAECVTGLPYDEPFLYNVYTSESIKGSKADTKSYPETNRLIPDYPNTSVELDDGTIKSLRGGVGELAKSVKKTENSLIRLNVTQNNINIGDQEGEFNKDIAASVTGDAIEIYFNRMYVKDVLMTVSKLDKLSQGNPTMGITGRLRPANIHKENVYDIVLLPVRLY